MTELIEIDLTPRELLDRVIAAGWRGVRYNPSRTYIREMERAGLIIVHYDRSPAGFAILIPTERAITGLKQ